MTMPLVNSGAARRAAAAAPGDLEAICQLVFLTELPIAPGDDSPRTPSELGETARGHGLGRQKFRDGCALPSSWQP